MNTPEKRTAVLEEETNIRDIVGDDMWLQPDSFFVAELVLEAPANKKYPVISIKKSKTFTNVLAETPENFNVNDWKDFSFFALKHTFDLAPQLLLKMTSKASPVRSCFMIFDNLNADMALLFNSDTSSVMFVHPSELDDACSVKSPFEWIE